MKFHEFFKILEELAITPYEFCKIKPISHGSLKKYLAGERPTLYAAKKIEKMTNGKVSLKEMGFENETSYCKLKKVKRIERITVKKVMKIDEFFAILGELGITPNAFCKIKPISRLSLKKYLTGERPTLYAAKKIEKMTNGKISLKEMGFEDEASSCAEKHVEQIAANQIMKFHEFFAILEELGITPYEFCMIKPISHRSLKKYLAGERPTLHVAKKIEKITNGKVSLKDMGFENEASYCNVKKVKHIEQITVKKVMRIDEFFAILKEFGVAPYEFCKIKPISHGSLNKYLAGERPTHHMAKQIEKITNGRVSLKEMGFEDEI